MAEESTHIPGVETDDLLQQAILWPASDAVADEFGAVRLDPSKDICCRWSLESTLSADVNSNAVQVVGKVFVVEEIPLGSILRKGTKSKPGSKTLYEVVGYCEKFDVFAEEARRYVQVSLWNGQLPAGA